VRKIDARGVITTIAGTGARGADDGPAGRATFNGPKAIRCDGGGDVFVVDTENHSVRKLDVKALRVTTVAGGRQGKGGDGGEARAAGLDRPHGVVIDRDGTLYVADSGNHRVRRVRP
jgi:DNA-binding beta-propeller fold protein YncE